MSRPTKRPELHHLQLRGNTWHCRLNVPKKLQDKVGKKLLVVNLRTSSVAEAKNRRPAALAHMKDILKRAERGDLDSGDPEFEKALEWREMYVGATSDEDREVISGEVGWVADDIRYRRATGGDSETAHPQDVERSHWFYEIATAQQTPISLIIDKYLAVNSDVPPKTDYTRRMAFRKLLEAYPEASFEAFTKAHAVDYVDSLASLNPVTANTRLWPLSSLWSFAVKRQVCENNVWRDLRFSTKHKGKGKRPFYDSEVVTLLTEADKMETPLIGDMWRFLLLTGCRISEACNIKTSSVEPNFIRIEGGKSASARRRIWISSGLFPVVGPRLNEGIYLFHEIREPQSGSRSHQVGKEMNLFRRSLGIDERPDGQRQSSVDVHSTRRWWATKALQAGISRDVVDACGGWSSKGMSVGVYSGGFSDDQVRACFEAVKLPEV